MNDVTSFQSPDIAALAAALAAAQSEVDDARMNGWNPHFEKRYADLSDIWAACRRALTKNGLAVSQLPRTSEKLVTVRTILMHSSGQWIAGELSAPADKVTPQGIGGAVTYLRRFGLAAIVGIAPRGDDDDGEGSEPRDGRGRDDSRAPEREPERSRGDDRRPSDASVTHLSDGQRQAIDSAVQRASRSAGDHAAAAQTGVDQSRGNPVFDPAHVALAEDFERRANMLSGDPAPLYEEISVARLPEPLMRRALLAVFLYAFRSAPTGEALDHWAGLAAKLKPWGEERGNQIKEAVNDADDRIARLAAAA